MKKFFLFLTAILLTINDLSQKVVEGQTVDISNSPIDSVKVERLGGKFLTYTDMTGYFKVSIPDTVSFLVFEYKGFKKIEFLESNKIKVVFPFYSSEDAMITRAYSKRHYEMVKTESRGIFKSKKPLTFSTEAETFSVYDESVDKPLPQPGPGLLTAGEVNDFAKWKLWQDITNNELKQYVSIWQIYPHQRYTVQVSDTNNLPIVNATVNLYDKNNNLIWSARTDNTGRAELWANNFDTTKTQPHNNLKISVIYNNEVYNLKKVKEFHKGINRLVINTSTKYPDVVDIAFVIDITGSMSDELEYLKAEISDIISKVKVRYRNLNYKVAIVVYKDSTDEFVHQEKDFTTSINESISFLNKYFASGGGDYPEAVDAALDVAINKLSWDDNARTRLMFLVLDAPPHDKETVKYRIKKAVYNASQKGIKIIPLSASGINKSTEYLLRSLALSTN